MNEEILNNIWNTLSQNGLTNSDFDSWKENFSTNPNVRNNVYNYLKDNDLTNSSQQEWINNIVGKQVSSTVDPTLDDDFSASYDLPQVDVAASQEDDTWIERTFGKWVATDYLGDLWRAGEQGFAQGATVDEAFDVYKKGKDISDEELRRYIEVSDALDKTGASDEMRRYEEIKTKLEVAFGVL